MEGGGVDVEDVANASVRPFAPSITKSPLCHASVLTPALYPRLSGLEQEEQGEQEEQKETEERRRQR